MDLEIVIGPTLGVRVRREGGIIEENKDIL